jgi:nitroreductase
VVLEGPGRHRRLHPPQEAWVRAFDGQNYAMVDGALALDHMTLAAAELGLGTCWIGAFDPAAAREILGLPDGVAIVGLTPLGYPDLEPNPRVRSRRPLGETVMKERWG